MKKLTKKAEAAWQLILNSAQRKIDYVGYGSAQLADGTKIHSHTMGSLYMAGYVDIKIENGLRHYEPVLLPESVGQK